MMKDIFDVSCCVLCPKECKKDRTKGEKGSCGTSDKLIIARASLHMWEEPCISGENGSGTVFFSGCNLGCVFCQNNEISHRHHGYEVDEGRLCEIFFELFDKGAHNINLVTATHQLPKVLAAVAKAKTKGLKIPFVYNTSGYEKTEAIARCEGLIDVFLPDFKYIEKERAKKYSKAPDYPEVAKAALQEMVRQQPKCVFSDNGLIKNGVIIRHLMLPDGLDESKKVIEYLYKTYGDSVYLSIMSQYTPFGDLEKFPELKRCVKQSDYDALVDFACDIGVENAFIQEGTSASESFIPDFSGQGIIKEVK